MTTAGLPRRTALWVTALVVALALPLFLAPSLAQALDWHLNSVVTRLMLVGGGTVLLCWFGLPDKTTIEKVLGQNPWRSVGRALGITTIACALYSVGLIVSGCEALRANPSFYRPDRIPLGLATGLAVSLIEEPVFRRVLLRRVGAVIASFLYSLIHYIRPAKISLSPDYTLGDSLAVYQNMLGNLLGPFRDPAPGFGLFLLGLLLCAVVRRGGLAWTVGIHAGLVFYVKASPSIFYWNHPGRHWLFGTQSYVYDGALFWMVCGTLLLVVLRLPIRHRT